MAKKTRKGPGDRIHIRLKQDEPDHIIDWINAQSEISESLRVLISKHVSEYGFTDICNPMNSFQFKMVLKPPIETVPREVKITPSLNTEVVNEGVANTNYEHVVSPNVIINENEQTMESESEFPLGNKVSEGTVTKKKKKPNRNIEINNW